VSAQSAQKIISVVGRNVSAAFCLLELAKSHKGYNLCWHQSKQQLPEEDLWTSLSESQAKEAEKLGVKVKRDETLVFIDAYQRYPLSHLIQNKYKWKNQEASLLKKFIALALFNDSSPQIYQKDEQNRIIIDPNWIQKSPVSLAAFNEKQSHYAICSYGEYFDKLESKAASLNVNFSDLDKRVASLELNENGKHKLLFNPPFRPTSTDQLIWSCPIVDDFKIENVHNQDFYFPQPLPQAFWQSESYEVKQQFVTALPPFSLWIDQSSAELFFKTGIFSDRSIRKVYCLPITKEKSILQVDSWRQQNSDFDFANKMSEERFDKFLWRICPYLPKLRPKISSHILNENYVYSNNYLACKKLYPHLYFNHRSFCQPTKQFASQALQELH